MLASFSIDCETIFAGYFNVTRAIDIYISRVYARIQIDPPTRYIFFPLPFTFHESNGLFAFLKFPPAEQFKTRFNIFSRQRRSPCFILFAFRCNVCKFAPRLNFRSIDLPINSKFSTITNFLAFFLFLLFNILPISCILHFTGITLSYQAVLLHRLEFRLGG